MPDFKDRITRHSEHVKNAGPHCSTEETTKQALILPLLDVLGFSPYDPTKVKAEYGANLPTIKANERVDYALFVENNPIMYIEAKSCTDKLTNHTGQLARYFNATPGVFVAAITNGREWRFFSDQKHSNIMDSSPFLTVDFESITESDVEKLERFRYGRFNPDGMRTFAEEQTLQDSFTSTIESCLRDPDADFVRFIACRSDACGRLTPKQIEIYAPIVKKSLAEAISRVVVGGLNVPIIRQVQSQPMDSPQGDSPNGDIIDPSNPKIVTTDAERRVLEIIQAILEGQADPDEIVGKDTETYYSICYRGKNNRWLLRYYGNRGTPFAIFNIPMDQERTSQAERVGLAVRANNGIALAKPEHLMKLSNMIFDALEYCKDDDNFRKKNGTGTTDEVDG